MKCNKLFTALAAAAFTLGVFGTGILAEGTTGESVSELVGSPVNPNGFYEGKDGNIYCYKDGKKVTAKWEMNPEDDCWYYLGTTGAAAKDQWQASKGKWYYLNADGQMVTDGFYEDAKGDTYAFDEKGAMQKGWVKDSKGDWYYFSNTKVTSDWVKYNNKWYYMDEKGVMQTGEVTVAGKVYYLDAKGAMVKGWVKVPGTDPVQWNYYGSDKKAATWVESNYYMDADGVMIRNAYVFNGSKYYWVGANGKYMPQYTTTKTPAAKWTVYDQKTGLVK